jgi:hypothetical protein
MGTLTALLGGITGGLTFTSIKKMGSEVHYIMSPLSWCLANLLLCPIFTIIMRVTL